MSKSSANSEATSNSVSSNSTTPTKLAVQSEISKGINLVLRIITSLTLLVLLTVPVVYVHAIIGKNDFKYIDAMSAALFVAGTAVIILPFVLYCLANAKCRDNTMSKSVK